MIWYFSFQILGALFVLGLFTAYALYKVRPLFSFLWKNKRWVLFALLTSFTLITLLTLKPLYRTAQCHFTGVSMKSETKYSWYLKVCQVKTKSGSYVPLRSSRGLPDGGREEDPLFEYDEFE